MWLAVQAPTPDLLTPTWFRDMIGRLGFSQHYLLPSWWLSAGLLQAARGVWGDAVMFLVLMISNALFAHQVGLWVASRVYRRSYGDLLAQGTTRRRGYISWIDRALLSWAFFLSPAMRLLIVKDLRLFRRDPVQWSQFLIFFGLLGLYFANLRRFHYDLNYKLWVNLISFLNVAVIGLLLATFTTRFIFPMISLEGRRFWVLGLLPIRRETILWSKFLFAALGSCLSCTLLVLLSDLVLRVGPLVVAIHVLSCLVLCLGLSAIAVGLGAALPNLREDSPSKIAAGFGGTLNLVVSSIYIILVVLLTALPCHLYLSAMQAGTELLPYAGGQSAGTTWWRSMLSLSQLKWMIAGGVAGSVVLAILATVLPLRMGFRAFRQMEF
jgi:ABC-2 type transport system permease protein